MPLKILLSSTLRKYFPGYDPVKRISFSEAGDTMNAEFRVQVYVYLNYERIDEITDKMSVSKDKEELLG